MSLIKFGCSKTLETDTFQMQTEFTDKKSINDTIKLATMILMPVTSKKKIISVVALEYPQKTK